MFKFIDQDEDGIFTIKDAKELVESCKWEAIFKEEINLFI